MSYMLTHTSVDDPVDIVQIRQSFQDSVRYLTHNIDINGSDLLVDTVKGALVHELHTYADVGVGDERAIEGDDVARMAVMHDLQLTEDLFPHGRLRVNQHNLDGRCSSRR